MPYSTVERVNCMVTEEYNCFNHCEVNPRFQRNAEFSLGILMVIEGIMGSDIFLSQALAECDLENFINTFDEFEFEVTADFFRYVFFNILPVVIRQYDYLKPGSMSSQNLFFNSANL